MCSIIAITTNSLFLKIVERNYNLSLKRDYGKFERAR